eukprot:972946-Pleurochrysis_carterae.AAC.1
MLEEAKPALTLPGLALVTPEVRGPELRYTRSAVCSKCRASVPVIVNLSMRVFVSLPPPPRKFLQEDELAQKREWPRHMERERLSDKEGATQRQGGSD